MLDTFLHNRRAEIERRLQAALPGEPGCPASLLEAMRYSLLAPGKRLRPLLALLAHEACGTAKGDPWPAALAIEMVHVYSLIHDDLPAMDDDDLRRGQPTCHVKFDEATAILAGDALLTRAFEVLAVGYAGSAGAACCLELARAAGAAGMVGGQVDDLAWEKEGPKGRTLEELETLHGRKTGALIRAALRLGAWAAYAHEAKGPPSPVLAALDGYGRCLGLAFQITDDLLDVEGHADQAGKRVGKDAARGKLTYPGLLGTEESRARAETLGRQARAYLESPPFAGGAERTGKLLDLVSYVLNRDR